MLAHTGCVFFSSKVVEAMRHTVTNMVGTLPPQFFAVTVTTVMERHLYNSRLLVFLLSYYFSPLTCVHF